MACRDDLAAGLACGFCEYLIDLPLPQNLQVRVGLVQKQDGSRIYRHVREQKKCLLLATTAC